MAIATLGSSDSTKGLYRTICFALCLSFAIVNLAGCSVPSFLDKSTEDSAQRAARPEKLKTTISAAEARTLARPAQTSEGFSAQMSQQGALGFAGLKTSDLFTDKLSDSGARFERLEGAVQNIRDEIDRAAPSINRLIAIEGDIQDLISQLEVLLNEEPASGAPETQAASPKQATAKAATPQKAAPKPAATTAPKTSTKAPPKQPYTPYTGTPILQKIRMSDNGATTRIVLETRGKMDYSTALDNNEHLLTLFFETGNADEGISRTPLRSRLIKAISPTPQTEGLILAVSLSADSQIVKQGIIAPSADNHNYRIYIDLANGQ